MFYMLHIDMYLLKFIFYFAVDVTRCIEAACEYQTHHLMFNTGIVWTKGSDSINIGYFYIAEKRVIY